MVEIYKGMFRYQVSVGLLPLVLIISTKEIKLMAATQVYLVEIYNGMFRYHISIGLLPLIFIVLINEAEL